jgi:hypothetical protein
MTAVSDHSHLDAFAQSGEVVMNRATLGNQHSHERDGKQRASLKGTLVATPADIILPAILP